MLPFLILFALFTNISGPLHTNAQATNQRGGFHLSFDRQKDQAIRNYKSKEVKQSMNLDADPCQDFFEFACGKWSENNAPKNLGEILTPQSEVEVRVNKDLQLTLNEPTRDISPAGRKVLNFYQTCVAALSISPVQQTFMLNFIRKRGGIPSLPNSNWLENYDWLAVIAQLRAQYGLDVLIGFEVAPNVETARGNSIYFGEPKTTIISSEFCSAVAMDNLDIRDESYEQLQDEISNNMQKWVSMRENDAKLFSGDVVRFEFELCKKMRIEQSMPVSEPEPEENETQNYPRRNPIGNVGQNRLHGKRNGQYQRKNLHQLSPFENAIDFRRYVLLVLNEEYQEPVFLRSEQYLKHLARIIRSTPKPTLANYISYRALAALNFPADERSTTRPAYCVSMVQKYFPKIAGDLYSRRSQRIDLRDELESYLNDVKKALESSLENEWISENTKRTAQQKLAQFNANFPVYQNLDLNGLHYEQENYWRKLELIMHFNANQDVGRLSNADPDDRPDSIESFDVNAKLMPLDNAILVGWALMQPPLFSTSYPRGMKYALLGQRLARELVMAFDEQGWRPSVLSARQWDEYTAQGFRNRSECYRAQYSNYLYNNPDDFRNASKLREIIADSNGLNLAFTAYLNWLGSMEPNHRGPLFRETLTDVDFTNTQLFFIHFAQTRCARHFEEISPPKFLPLDRHTPERYNVNGPLSNIAEFAREFHCKSGDEMNPDEKCVIY